MFGIERRPSSVLLAVLLTVTVGGCGRQAGPVEQVGKDIDSAVEKAGDQLEKTGDAIDDATRPN
jgi:hypothetical protein